MTDWRDTHTDVRTLPLDSLAADRILAGEPSPEDSPAGVAEVAAIVRALRVEPTVAELARERQAVADLAAILRSQEEEVAPVPEPSRGTFPRLRVAAAVVLALLGATTALAAGGQLPGRAQDVASNVLGTIGIHVPKSDDERRKPPVPAGDESGPRPQTGGAGTADEEPSGTVSPQQGESDTGPVPSSGDRAEDEGGEKPTTSGGTTPPGAPSSTQPGITVPEPEETDEPTETTETTEPTTTDERKPKPPKENQGPPGAGGAGGGAQTETDTEAEDDDDVRPTRPPPPTVPQPPQLPPRNPRATDAQDEAPVPPRDTRGGSRGSR